MSSRIKVFVRAVSDKLDRDQIWNRSSSLALKAIFSLIPTLALIYYGFSLTGGLGKLQDRAEGFVVRFLAPSIEPQARQYISELQRHLSPGALGVFGVLGFLFTGVSMIRKVEETLNVIWGVRNARSWLEIVWLYTALLFITPIFVGGSLTLSSYVTSKLQLDGAIGSQLMSAILTIASFLITIAFFFAVFMILPHTKVHWRAALSAAAVTGVSLEVFKQAFTWYAAVALGHSIYGSLAALPVLFFWISLTCTMFCLGAELCYFLDQHHAGNLQIASNESFLSEYLLTDILTVASQAPNGSMDLKELVDVLKWDLSVITTHIEYLGRLGLLRPTTSGGIRVNFHDLESALRIARNRLNAVRYIPRTFLAIDKL